MLRRADSIWATPGSSQWDPENLARAGFEAFEPVGERSGARVLLVDHYDSFSYNLVQLCLRQGAQVRVCRSDTHKVSDLRAVLATHWVMSPGPGHPSNAGIRPKLWQAALEGQTPPVLGVCLGHQGLCLAMGARVQQARRILHGKKSVIVHDGQGLFVNGPQLLEVVRYHSLVVESGSLPKPLRACAWVRGNDGVRGELMAVRHASLPLFGVQFHPESVASQGGEQMLARFLSMGAPG